MTELVEVAKLGDIPPGAMKAVTVGNVDILVANVAGQFHAMSGRCGHMNAPLAEGRLTGNIVECPFHAAHFDVTTGQKLREAVIAPPPGIAKAPPEMMPFLTKAGQMTARIKTLDCPRFAVVVEGDAVKVRI